MKFQWVEVVVSQYEDHNNFYEDEKGEEAIISHDIITVDL